ncbi:MAG: hypothetical protein HC913_16325 [Microscillaceae bacterium]|nr:hypothetical protein [Microscillaceae bacterium]
MENLAANPPKITFEVSLEEANLIFKALGRMPFAEVYELIGKLNAQANTQLSLSAYPQTKEE